MKDNYYKFLFTLLVVGILVLGYVFALDFRYKIIDDQFMLDTWSSKVTYILQHFSK